MGRSAKPGSAHLRRIVVEAAGPTGTLFLAWASDLAGRQRDRERGHQGHGLEAQRIVPDARYVKLLAKGKAKQQVDHRRGPRAVGFYLGLIGSLLSAALEIAVQGSDVLA